MRKLFSLFMALLATTTLWAYDFKYGDLYYNITSSSQKTVEVTYRVFLHESNYAGLTTITIPETVNYDGTTYSVTSIGDDAFLYCSSLTSVTIPNSVTSIGDWAFSDCYSLTSVTIGNSVTSIGYRAFEYCSSLTSITIPNSVTTVGGGMFFGCDKLESVVLSNNMISLPCYSEIQSHGYGSNYKEWYDIYGFFEGCSSLTSLTIPNSVTSIGEQAFSDCSALTSVTIPNSVTTVGGGMFFGCDKLESVVLSNNIISLPCYSEKQSYGSGSDYKVWFDICGFFDGCSSLTSVTIGNSVTSIGEEAFYGCSSLTSVTIGNSVTSIGEGAFYGCSSLTSVTIPNSVTSIGGYAFRSCSSLTSMVVEEGNTTYDSRDNCNAIIKTATNTLIAGCQNTIIPNSVTSIGDDAFYGCSSLTSITIPNSVTNIGSSAFYGCSSLTSITILNSVTSIGDVAFQGCSSLTSITIPNSVRSIGNYAFYDCSSLTSVTIGNSVTDIGESAFYGCSSLSSVAIGNGVTKIDNSAFAGCTGLNLLRLGTGIQTIDDNAFADCTKLYDIYCLAAEPPTGYKSSFANYNAFIHVPCESQRLYMLDVLFGEFKYIECISSDEVTTDDIVITPGLTDVTIIWPSEDYADTYTIIIKKGNEVFCTLTFNKDGHLLNIAFAPGRDGNHPVQYAEAVANGKGFRFTVTGLEEATDYTYDITVKDASNKTIKLHSGKFTTESLTAVENTHIQSPMTDCQKIIHNGQLIILRDGVEYNAQGQIIKE